MISTLPSYRLPLSELPHYFTSRGAYFDAAKHALVGLTKQLALELGPHGVTVNSVAPGFVRSNEASEVTWITT